MIKRVVLIVLDSVGIGALPDAGKYGDQGADTLGHLSEEVELRLPNLEKMGLGKIRRLPGISADIRAGGVYGKMAESSPGKDTTTGHWELAGIILKRPFPVFPDGFPAEVIEPFKKAIGRDILGNKAASGTAIIEELGEEHLKTGRPIVYTSADSVFQIAAHEGVIPVEELYQICRRAREILSGDYAVGRVIARPFVGEPGNFTRTERREDFSLKPPAGTMLNRVKEQGLPVKAVGKIVDIFAGEGITAYNHTVDNLDSVEATIEYIREGDGGLIFTNLVEFDMLYGHRRDTAGYARALEEFDQEIPRILEALSGDDLLIITADHGCDPTYRGTDHTREYVPILIAGERVRADFRLETRTSLADTAATICELLGTAPPESGTSFADIILKG